MAIAHIPGWPGGIVREGASDTQRSDELRSCDSLDIGTRGALMIAPGVADYLSLIDPDTNVLEGVFLVRAFAGPDFVRELVIGQGFSGAGATHAYFLGAPFRSGDASPFNCNSVFGGNYAGTGSTIPRAEGAIVTVAPFSGIYKVCSSGGLLPTLVNLTLVNIGAREGFFAGLTQGLYAFHVLPTFGTFNGFTIDRFDALGTGERGEDAYNAGGGVGIRTKGKQLHFRGICSHSAYAFGWGHDQRDTANFDGPARLMFSNAGKPHVWGNDNIAVAGDRDFTDSDAIQIGDTGEFIRAGLSWNGRLWLGTNRQLHYIAGFGRDTWLTDGADSVPRAENCIGAHCLIEGPDKLLYGVGDQGLWAFDGGSFERHHRRLRDFRQMSLGYWDLIWTDRTRANTYPGKTNQDLVWMVVDWDQEQVVVGIPHCDASAGYGFGTDTVLLKFHTRSGGFTRQVFSGMLYTSGDFVRRVGQYAGRKFFGLRNPTPTAKLQVFDEKTAPNVDVPLPTALPDMEVGEYAFAGPDGAAIIKRAYLTLSWAAAGALPIRFNVQRYLDGQLRYSYKLTIGSSAPGAPAEGDLWVDTSLGDTNIGNVTAGVLIPSSPSFLLKLRRNAAWQIEPNGVTGGQGTRATIRIAFPPERSTRVLFRLTTELATGRFQVEGFGIKPPPITDAI